MISRIFRLCLALATGVILAFAGVPDAIAQCGGETEIGNLVAFLNCDPDGISYRNISRAMDRDVGKICRRACSNAESAKCRKGYLGLVHRHRGAIKRYARSKGCKFRSKYFEERYQRGGGRGKSAMFKRCKTIGNWKRTVYKPSAASRSHCKFIQKDAVLCEIKMWCKGYSEFHKKYGKDLTWALEMDVYCLADEGTGECPSIRECVEKSQHASGQNYAKNYKRLGVKGEVLEEQEVPKHWKTLKK